MRRILLAVLLLGAAPQEDIELKWGLDPGEAIEYEVYDASRGKPRLDKERTFIIFGTELKDGTNTLVINDYRDLGYHLLFRLPKDKINKKSKWTFDEKFFSKGRVALAAMLAYKTIKMQGLLRVRKFEKVNEIDCVLVEGQYQYFEIRYDSRNNPKVQRRPMGMLSTIQWLSVKDTTLVKGIFKYSGKGQEFKGIKQGEEPKTTKLNMAVQIIAKKERLKIDGLANLDSIKKAIEKGKNWLRTKQERNGSYIDKGGSFARDFPVGSTALCVMALLHSGVKKDDPGVQKAFAWMKRQAFQKVYDVAAMLMAYETKYMPMEELNDVESFSEEKAKKTIQDSITRADKAIVERAAKWLIEKQEKTGTWGYPDRGDSYDHSNTQYAMLGLKSAARCGVKIPSKVWKKAAGHWCDVQRINAPKVVLKLEFFRENDRGIEVEEKPDDSTRAQDPEKVDQGPWGYFIKKRDDAMVSIEDAGYGSMTCAGLTSLLIAESELLAGKNLNDKLKKRIETAKKQGLAWLQHNYSVRGNKPSAGFWSVFYYYYLYSLERVGVLYGIKTIDGHDWYQEGAMLLVRAQKSDGSWVDYDEIPVLDSAFALLFLRRATIPVATGVTKKK